MIRRLAKLCIPTTISLFLIGMYSVIDGLFIGRVTKDVGLAAINIAWPITALVTAVGIGIGTGCCVIYSHQRGQSLEEESQTTLGNGFIALLGSGIFLMILLLMSYKSILSILGASGEVLVEAALYSRIIILGGVFQIFGAGLIPILRNMGLPFEAMATMIVGMITNLAINYWLIVSIKMGIVGAAYGTVVSQALVALSSLLIIKKKGYRVRLTLSVKTIMKIVSGGISAFGISMAPSLALMITNKQCLLYGGDEAVACYAVISYIVFPVHSLLAGVGDGSQPLVSFYSGAGDVRVLQDIRRIACIFITFVSAMVLVLVLVAKPYIPVWFGISEQAASYFNKGMWISMISFLFVGFTKFGAAYMNASLKLRGAAVIIYGECLILSPLLLLLLPKYLGIEGIWISLPLTSVIMVFVVIVCMRKEVRSCNV